MNKKQNPSVSKSTAIGASFGKNELNIILRRKVEVKRYPVVAKVTFKKERQDLVSLLKASQRSDVQIPARLRAYLKRETLWDPETAGLTQKGQQVIDTCCIDQEERGLYHIWYTNNDPLLGTRPIFVQRYSAFGEPNHNVWKKGNDAFNSGFAVNTNCEVDLLEEKLNAPKTDQHQGKAIIASIKPEVLCSAEAKAHLDLEWALSYGHSSVTLKGQVEALKFTSKSAKAVVRDLEMNIEDYQNHLPEVLGYIAKQFGGVWDTQAKRMRVTLDAVRKYSQAVQKLEVGSRTIPGLNTLFGNFERVQCQHLPIKPEDPSDAKQWHQYWLASFHSKKYSSDSEAHLQQSNWLDHEGMSDFDLPLKLGQELLGSFGRENNPEAYWHVAAVADLSPSNSKKQSLPITLMQSDELSIEALIYQLAHGQQVQKIIYSDRYVHTRRQSHNLKVFADKSRASHGLLMTLNPPLGKGEAELPMNWERRTFKKDSSNHGRYWILFGRSQIWCWECSSGVDFIRHSGDTYMVEGTPTFTPKEKNELPHYLQEEIKKMKMEEVI
ncbi:hypothetical protein [Vibrio sp. CAU 1672]|uniref:hypothetical protein n=1 Tax=Vibrio sp. CAU 1672 TaxID=3032594 RepID=UPI0023DC514C|nr:hypothetical protein [Vibrio sp. CAU 1672]MDF2152534.1 hypothetical protein [Vibrio sp. CAU 1672]